MEDKFESNCESQGQNYDVYLKPKNNSKIRIGNSFQASIPSVTNQVSNKKEMIKSIIHIPKSEKNTKNKFDEESAQTNSYENISFKKRKI